MDLIKRIQEYSRDVGCIRFCKRHNAFNNEVGIPMEMVLPCLDCPKPAGANYFCHSSQETKANALDMTWGDHQRLDELDLCIFGLSKEVQFWKLKEI